MFKQNMKIKKITKTN